MGLSVHDPFVDPLGNPLGLKLGGGTGSSIGDIVTRLAPPAGQFLEADGRQLSKAMYSKLYAAIGDAYSVADFTARFTSVTLPAAQPWSSVAYGNGVFVTIADNNQRVSAVSADGGLTWQLGGQLPVATSWTSITFGNGVFVAVGASDVSATSPDGLSWTQRSMPSFAKWKSVAYGGGQFVAVAASSTTVATSPDGITWTALRLPQNSNWSSIAYGGGMFVVVSTGSATAASSPDGITWRQRELPSSAKWSSVVYGNGVFVAVASEAAFLAFSFDGMFWATGSGALASPAVVFGGGVFMIAPPTGTDFYYVATPAPVEFRDATLPISRTWTASAFGNGVLIVIGSGSATAARANVISPTNFNLPLVKPGDSLHTAYIKVA